jgi:hypothetical protein
VLRAEEEKRSDWELVTDLEMAGREARRERGMKKTL